MKITLIVVTVLLSFTSITSASCLKEYEDYEEGIEILLKTNLMHKDVLIKDVEACSDQSLRIIHEILKTQTLIKADEIVLLRSGYEKLDTGTSQPKIVSALREKLGNRQASLALIKSEINSRLIKRLLGEPNQ